MSSAKRPKDQQEQDRQSIKRRRCCLTIEDKIKLLDCLKAGSRPIDIRTKFGISESALRSIQQREKEFRQFAQKCPADAHKSVVYIPRNSTLERAEPVIFQWYERQRELGNTLTIASICDKAREVYVQLKKDDAKAKLKDGTKKDELEDANNSEDDYERDFKGSKGWFTNFRRRFNLDFKSTYETDPLDHQAAQQYCQEFRDKIASVYESHQVFSASQFSFAWKNLPGSTTFDQRDRNTHNQERICLLLCGNASGDYSVKPMLVYRTLTPYCMRSRDPEELPVFWRARPRNCQSCPKVTAVLFHEWLTECFIPSIRGYLHIMELPQRCVLLLDAGMRFPLLPYDDEFVQLEFLPPNTAALLQPIALGLWPVFKCKYFHQFMCFLFYSIEKDPKQSLIKLWRKFTISDGVDLIQETLEEIAMEDWNSGWAALWTELGVKPFCVSDLNDEMQRIADMASRLPGLGDTWSIDDIRNHLKINDEAMVKNKRAVGDDSMYETDDELEDTAENQKTVDPIPLKTLEDTLQHASSALNDNDNDKFQASEDEYECLLRDYDNANSTEQEQQISISNKSTAKIQSTENSCKVQKLNGALMLSQQLIAAIGAIDAKNFEKFRNNLNELMQPYKEMKEQLLQPSVRDYFK